MIYIRQKIIILFFCLVPGAFISGQTNNLPDIIISTAEELSAGEQDPEVITNYIDRLLELGENPVKINSADESELSRIFFLTEFQVKVLCDYVKTTGNIKTQYEIAYLPGFDNTLAMMMKPFIIFDAVDSFNAKSLYFNQTLTTNLTYKKEPQIQLTDISQLKTLTRYKLEAGDFTTGFTSEKDAGEQSSFYTGEAPDFLSGYLVYQGKGIVRNIIIGDYSVRFGQGTNVNSGFRTGLSLTSNEFMAGKNEIRQYTSTDENNFFRGTAAGFSLKFIDVYLFYSKNRIDASLIYDVDSIAVSVNSLYRTGLHDTESSINKKDLLTETSAGANVSLNIKNLRAGLTYSENSFSLPLINNSTELRDIYSFTGTRNSLWSADYKWLYKNIILFGEYTFNGDHGSGFLQGLRLRPDNRLAMNFIYRHYEKDFNTLHGNSPGSGSQINNETGILANFIYEAGKNFFISGGADFYTYPWLRYRCDAPSRGKKYEFKTGYYPSDFLSIETSFNYRDNMLNNTGSEQMNKLSVINNRSVKTIIKYSPDEFINLGTRVEYKVISPSGSKGMVLSQDFNYDFKRVPVRLWLRWCIYNTDDYDSRIYLYENDMVNSFSIPAFYDEGNRSYMMIALKIFKSAELRFKYGITTTIEPDVASYKEDFKFQFRISV